MGRILSALVGITIASLVLAEMGWSSDTVILFEDDFSEPSTFPEKWEIHDAKDAAEGPSEWVVQDGELWQKSNIYRSGNWSDFFEGTHVVTKQGAGWEDYEISVDFRISGDNDGVGVLFRYLDTEHYYRFITVEDPVNLGPFRRIDVKDGDSYTTLAESEEGYDAAMPHHVKVSVVGEDIAVFFDGQLILTAKDARYTSGRIGLQTYAEQPLFDNVRVLDLMSTEVEMASDPRLPDGFYLGQAYPNPFNPNTTIEYAV